MRKELIELKSVMQSLRKLKDYLDLHGCGNDNVTIELLNGIESVNMEIFGCKEYPQIPLQRGISDLASFNRQFERWENVLLHELDYRKSFGNKTDYDFAVLSSRIQILDEEELVEKSIACLKKIRQDDEHNYQYILGSYNAFDYFWGALDLDHGVIDLLYNRIHEIKSHWEDFCWLYNNLEDYRSKKVLYGILHYWLTFDWISKNGIVENNFDDYFDFDFVTCKEDEVFVDLGAYNGDSAYSYIENFGNYKRIYCYEMTDSSMKKIKQKLAGFDNVICRQVAVGNSNDMVCMATFDDASCHTIISQKSNGIEEHEKVWVSMVKLDDDIQEPITFLKMDIEGSELDAMQGAERHIREDKPKLAVCSYHNNHHIYEIPRLMREYNPQYKLYMRYNGAMNNSLTSEYVTFAIP